MVRPYRMIYVAAVLLGACLKIDLVINCCDVLNGLMALPNLIALVILSPLVLKLSRDYFTKPVHSIEKSPCS